MHEKRTFHDSDGTVMGELLEERTFHDDDGDVIGEKNAYYDDKGKRLFEVTKGTAGFIASQAGTDGHKEAEKSAEIEPEYMTHKEAARYLRMTGKALHGHVGRKRIKKYKQGNENRYKKEWLDAFMESRSNEAEIKQPEKRKATG